MPVSRAGLAIVVKEVVAVVVTPAESVAVTVAAYRCLFLRGLLGTQDELSSRSAPPTEPPLASLTATLVTVPPLILNPISALTGTLALPLAGVSVIAAAEVPPALPDSVTGPPEADADGGELATHVALA